MNREAKDQVRYNNLGYFSHEAARRRPDATALIDLCGARPREVNYGELEARPAPDIAGRSREGAAWSLASLRGRWALLIVTHGACEAPCERALYATRQARTIQNREQERVLRVLLQPTGAGAPSSAVVADHPGLAVVEADPTQWQTLPGVGANSIYVVDPLGNVVLRYPFDPDIKRMAKDLERLLKASRIG